MARRKHKAGARVVMATAALVLIAGGGWYAWRHLGRQLHDSKVSVHGASERIDAANEGLRVQLKGDLVGAGPVRDVQLGVSANAAVLFRHVEMFQWQEHCKNDEHGMAVCAYDTAWSGPVDSSKFREAHGHQANPVHGKNPPMPFNDAAFFAPGLKLGVWEVDPDLLVAQLTAKDYPVRNASLPPNLAATFAERDGVLYAGGDPAHPAVGEVRVSYRAVGTGAVTLNGVQRGSRLAVQ